MSYKVPRHCCQHILTEACDVCYSCLSTQLNQIPLGFCDEDKHPQRTKPKLTNSIRPSLDVQKSARMKGLGSLFSLCCDYVSPCSWINIIEQSSFRLPCYVPDSPFWKLIWYKPRDTLESPGNALKLLLCQANRDVSRVSKKKASGRESKGKRKFLGKKKKRKLPSENIRIQQQQQHKSSFIMLW